MILIGVLCFLSMTAEGALGDWGGIYLRENLGASAAAVGDGASPASRSGWRSRGSEATGSTSASAPACCCAAGWRSWPARWATLLLIAQPVPAVIGFVLVGLGIANAVPILFSAAGRHEPTGPSLSAVFTVGYTGFIVGPPLIGVCADAIGLPDTLALICLAALAVVVLGGRATAIPVPDRSVA